MLHVYNCILLNMSAWGSKHVEENIILWINSNQCIKLVINIKKNVILIYDRIKLQNSQQKRSYVGIFDKESFDRVLLLPRHKSGPTRNDTRLQRHNQEACATQPIRSKRDDSVSIPKCDKHVCCTLNLRWCVSGVLYPKQFNFALYILAFMYLFIGYDMSCTVLVAVPKSDYAFCDPTLCRLANKIWDSSPIIPKYK